MLALWNQLSATAGVPRGVAKRDDRSLGIGFKGMSYAAALEEPAIEQITERKTKWMFHGRSSSIDDPVNLMSYVTMVFQPAFLGIRARKTEVTHARGASGRVDLSSGAGCGNAPNYTSSNCTATSFWQQWRKAH